VVVSATTLNAIERAYQGEVFGIAMYSLLAEAQQDPFRRWQWQCLVHLEIETRAATAALLTRLGITTIDDPSEVQAGEAEARRIMHLPWHEMIREFASDLPELVAEYAAVEAKAGLSGEDGAVLHRLTLHEEVTLAFCEAELAGESSSSIEPVIAMLDNPPARP